MSFDIIMPRKQWIRPSRQTLYLFAFEKRAEHFLKSAQSTFRTLFGRFSDAFRTLFGLCVFIRFCVCLCLIVHFRTLSGRFSDAFRTLFGRFSNAFRTLFGTCNFEVFSVEETCSMCAHFISPDASECKIREWMREKCSDPLFRANLALTFWDVGLSTPLDRTTTTRAHKTMYTKRQACQQKSQTTGTHSQDATA